MNVENRRLEASGETDISGLVYRFWLSFIREITEPHLEESGRDKLRNLIEERLAENIEKATEMALSGTPPHRCGSFGRAALSVVRGRTAMSDQSPALLYDHYRG